MNASATSDFSPPDSSDSRFIDLPAGVTSTSTPGSRSVSASSASARASAAASACSGGASSPPMTGRGPSG